LLAQRELGLLGQYDAAQAYIRSQAHAGWTLIRPRYADGGYSGGSTERLALHGYWLTSGRTKSMSLSFTRSTA
jgi:hypothetical protein